MSSRLTIQDACKPSELMRRHFTILLMRAPRDGRLRLAQVPSWPLVALILICLNLGPPGANLARQNKLGVPVSANQSWEMDEMGELETASIHTRSTEGKPIDMFPWLGIGWMPHNAPNMLPQFSRFVGFITRLNQISFIAHFVTCAYPTSSYSRTCVAKDEAAMEQYTLNPPSELDISEWPREGTRRLYGCDLLDPIPLSADFSIYKLTFEFPTAAKQHMETVGKLPKSLRPRLARSRGPYTKCQLFSYSGTERRRFSYFDVEMADNDCRSELCEFRSIQPPKKSGLKPGRVCPNNADLGAPIFCYDRRGLKALTHLVAKVHEKKKVCSLTFDALSVSKHHDLLTQHLAKDLTYKVEPKMRQGSSARFSFRGRQVDLFVCPIGPRTANSPDD